MIGPRRGLLLLACGGLLAGVTGLPSPATPSVRRAAAPVPGAPVGRGPAPEVPVAPARLPRDRPDAPPSREAKATRTARGIATLISRLSRMAAEKTLAERGADRAWLAVVKRLAQSPEDVARAADLIRTGDLEADVVSLLLCAFGAAGSPACQHALLESLADRQLGPRLRQSALVGLARLRAAGAPTLDRLRRFAEREEDPVLAGGALLALGAVGRRARRDRQAQWHETHRYLSARYRQARDDRQRVAALRALGNLGHPDALGVVRAAASGSLPVRAAAMTALRRVRTPEAERLLAERLSRVPEPPVAAAALDALTGRSTPRAIQAVVAALDHPSGVVRSAALDALRVVADDPVARAAIEDASLRDADPAVRRRATTWLSRSRGGRR